MLITKTSVLTGKKHTIEIPVTQEQLNSWHSGTHIQYAMPNLTPSQREFLMTGATDEEWNKVFPKEKEGGNDDEDDDSNEEYLSAMFDLNDNPR